MDDAIFSFENGAITLRTPNGWLLWYSTDSNEVVTLGGILKTAKINLKKYKS